MVSVASFDPPLRAVLVATLITVALLVVLLLRVAYLRLANLRAEQRRGVLAHTWRPVFAQTLVGLMPALPPLAAREFFPFLALWNHYFLSVKGEARQHLVDLAERLAIPARLPALLRGHSKHRQLEAIHLLGRMRAESGCDQLIRIARAPDQMLSLAALRALLEIQPERAISLLLPVMLARRDWSEVLIANILIETHTEAITAAMVAFLPRAAPAQQPRLLYWLEVTRCRAALPFVRQLLAAPVSDEVIFRCLRLASRLADGECLPLARNYYQSPIAGIRQCVAAYLARCGTRDDVPLLLELTGDARWPVRHEAARALLALPFLDRTVLVSAQQTHSDRFARDMLTQAFAEVGLGGVG